MVVASQLSLEAFLNLPETQPAQEYSNGQISSKPMPKGRHSRLQTGLATALNQVAEPEKIALAFTELRCTFAGRSLVPDISVFSWQRIPLNPEGEVTDTFTAAPNWAIEILSPEQSSMQVIEKILFCLNNGTELGWLIDPEVRSVMSFKPQQQPQVHQGEAILPTLSILPGFRLSCDGLFGYLTLS
ncbi:Uma2 family endonuclease [Roseofilum sp. BLCC_M154]|uniref:Uma2 family endonuclease n=1 Tax=Roseofilum acuticapitatum BLCC-M154 TaxID=3022444 RepID=A0ABT7ATB8_9CYAN|nr:Uma2 family endonuclease [Roseofilum acuticapitatum]MDJ1170146.1 Uma2 family endonuclease [Roseofilum acuticapitatum BLCC-M154]